MLEETYLSIISSKTAALFSASSKVGSIITDKESKYKDALEFYGKNLGLTFQIADDTLDYNSELKMFGKEIGKDFFEGKVTLPIILLNQKLSSEEKLILKEIFEQDTRSKEQFDYVLKLVKKYNIIKDCYKKAEHYIGLASNSCLLYTSDAADE